MIAQLSANWVNAMGWMLIHFLWQGLAVAAVLWFVLALVSQKSSRIRYALTTIALVLMFLIPLASVSQSLWRNSQNRERSSAVAIAPHAGEDLVRNDSTEAEPEETTVSEPLRASSSAKFSIEPVLPWLVGLWILGVLIADIHLISSLMTLCHWKRSGRVPKQTKWPHRFQELARELRVFQKIQLLESSSTTVPMVVGWLKPVVLIPAGFLASLPPHQIEAILLHELAHIRRCDFLVNFLQNLVETFFFFHPAVWWVGKQVRIEREHCCDDLAASHCANSLTYAQALTALEELNVKPNLAMVALKSVSLLQRIRRLADAQPKQPRFIPVITITASIVMGLIVIYCLPSGVTAEMDSQRNGVAGVHDVELVDSPEVNVDGKPALLIRVLDGETDKPIDSFFVVGGVPIRPDSLNADFKRQFPNVNLVNWQPHTARVGNDGEYYWPLARAYDSHCLRVEVDGYIPQHFSSVDKSGGSQTITFRLQKEPGVKGQVFLTDGKPAANAIVGIGITSRHLQIQDGKFRGQGFSKPTQMVDRWKRPIIVQADNDGRFVLPTEPDESARVAAIHDDGMCHMYLSEFKKKQTMNIAAWGQIEGTVKIGDNVAPGEQLLLYTDLTLGYPNPITSYVYLESDESGNFPLTKVPAGMGSWQLEGFVPRNDEWNFNAWDLPYIPEDAMGGFQVQSGDSKKISLGGPALDGEKLKALGQFRINIDQQGNLTLNGKATKFDELPKFGAEARVIINPVRNAKYQEVMNVLEKCSKTSARVYFSQGSRFYPKESN